CVCLRVRVCVCLCACVSVCVCECVRETHLSVMSVSVCVSVSDTHGWHVRSSSWVVEVSLARVRVRLPSGASSSPCRAWGGEQHVTMATPSFTDGGMVTTWLAQRNGIQQCVCVCVG